MVVSAPIVSARLPAGFVIEDQAVVGAAPLDAAVTRPFPFTVMLAYVKDPTLEFTVASVSALEPEVVASPLISAALKAEESPRTRPVNVLPVPVPPLATGTTENVVVGGFPAPPPKTNCPEASAAEEAHVVAPEK